MGAIQGVLVIIIAAAVMWMIRNEWKNYYLYYFACLFAVVIDLSKLFSNLSIIR